MSDADELLEYRKKELYELMSDISEDCYCAGWMHGNEFRLWDAITDPDDDRRYGMGEIEPQQVQRLKELSQLSGGWWRWDETEGPQFVVLERWEGILRRIEEKNLQAEAQRNVFHPYCHRCKTRAPSSGGCIADDCGIRNPASVTASVEPGE